MDEGSVHLQAWWERDANNERRRRVVNAAKALRRDPSLDAARGRWGDPAEPDVAPGKHQYHPQQMQPAAPRGKGERPAWDSEFSKESPFKDGFGWNRRAAQKGGEKQSVPAARANNLGAGGRRRLPWEDEMETGVENGVTTPRGGANDYDAANYKSPHGARDGGAVLNVAVEPSPVRESMPDGLVGRLEQRRRQRAAELEARRAAAENGGGNAAGQHQDNGVPQVQPPPAPTGPIDVLHSPTGLSPPQQNRRRRRMWDMPSDASPAAKTAAAAAAAAQRGTPDLENSLRQPSNNTFTRRVAAMANAMDRGLGPTPAPQAPSRAAGEQPSRRATVTPPRPKTGGERAAAAPADGPDPSTVYAPPPRSSPGCHGSDYRSQAPEHRRISRNVARPLIGGGAGNGRGADPRARRTRPVESRRAAPASQAAKPREPSARRLGVQRTENVGHSDYPVAYIASDKRKSHAASSAAADNAANGSIPIKKPAKAPANPSVASGVAMAGQGGQNALRAAVRKLSAAPRRKADGASKAPPDDPSTRQMFDKRRMRIEHRLAFSACVMAWRSMRAAAAAIGGEALANGAGAKNSHVKAFVRKRPLFEHELKKGEFDVVTVPKDAVNAVVVHNCLTYPDLKRLYAKHVLHRDGLATCFDEVIDDASVYGTAGSPLVRHALGGGIAALFMYGQTGSGKTFTMSGIERRAMTELFDLSVRADVARSDATSAGSSAPLAYATVRYFEIAGKRAIDLLHPSTPEFPVKEEPPSASNGYVGAADVSRSSVRRVSSAQDLLALIEEGKSRRATSPTLVNANSSRSHAVLTITLPMAPQPGGEPGPDGGIPPGRLVLVDCAGSERKEDSMYHDASQRKEGAEINASLWALKECARALNMIKRSNGRQHVHVPYRSSTLTKVLQESFARRDAKLHVVGTVSPSASDTEHSLETLKFVTMLGGSSGDSHGASEEREDVPRDLRWDGVSAMRHIAKRVIPPHLWDNAELKQWCHAQRGLAAQCRIPPNLTGREVVRMNRAALAALCGGDGSAGAALHDLLRNEILRCSNLKAQGAL